MTTSTERYAMYLRQLRTSFIKVCRARFLNPDGSTAFSVERNPYQMRDMALISDQGTFTCKLQNGMRRSLSLTFVQITPEFDYNVNNIWFGTEIAWDEGLLLPDGTPFYIQQGIFGVENPEETINPEEKCARYNLVDKWANLDGKMTGNLEATYIADAGTSIFPPIAALLAEDRGNGRPLDNIAPIFTTWYNDKTQELPDGTTARLTDAPYTLMVEPGTKADVILGFATMLNAWVGYDSSGALRIDPSQDDISDATKPVEWEFSEEEAQLLGRTYAVENTDVYNDVIVIGEQVSGQKQPAARAQNLDPASDTNVNLIGRKTLRISSTGFGTTQQCIDYALWKLKRTTVLQKSVTIRCSQMMHIQPNQLVTIKRTDKPGNPTERHLVLGFSRPVSATEEMTINCVSVNDFPDVTLISG